MEANGIALGLTAAVCWGVADFCARGASRTGGTFVTLLLVQPIGIVGVLAFALPFGLLHLQGAPPLLVLAAAAVNLLIMAGAGFLYQAFAVGKLALVSPIAAGFAAITALLSLLSGERPSPLALAGIALTIVGVIVASAVPETAEKKVAELVEEAREGRDGHARWHPPRGLAEALAATLIFGVGYWLLHFISPQLGGVTVAFIGKVADFVVLSVLAVALVTRRTVVSGRTSSEQRRRVGTLALVGAGHQPVGEGGPDESERERLRGRRALLPAIFWLFIIPTGLLDTLANVAYNVGISVALTSIVVVLSSLFSAVTVLLAWVFLRERLAAWQWAGVVAILIGIALVNL